MTANSTKSQRPGLQFALGLWARGAELWTINHAKILNRKRAREMILRNPQHANGRVSSSTAADSVR